MHRLAALQAGRWAIRGRGRNCGVDGMKSVHVNGHGGGGRPHLSPAGLEVGMRRLTELCEAGGEEVRAAERPYRPHGTARACDTPVFPPARTAAPGHVAAALPKARRWGRVEQLGTGIAPRRAVEVRREIPGKRRRWRNWPATSLARPLVE